MQTMIMKFKKKECNKNVEADMDVQADEGNKKEAP